MIVKQIIDEDFANYKTPSMVIMFPRCSWKCGEEICHNAELENMPDIEISIEAIIRRFTSNVISTALVCSGLEPFDSYNDLIMLARAFRKESHEPIIIYTGYTEEELSQYTDLYGIKNVIIKYGRFIPGHQSHFDDVLGVKLPSDSQYARHIS